MNTEKQHVAHREDFKITFDLSGEYAKWLLSTLLLLNSGAIAGIFQKDATNIYPTALWFFGLGVIFALMSGALAWFNLQFAATHYRLAASDILAERDERPQPAVIKRTRIWAILAAFASIGWLVLGAISVALTLR